MGWVLVIIFGISGWGAGGQRVHPMPDKATCLEALESMRIEAAGQKSGEDDEQVIAYCKPSNAALNPQEGG